MAFKSESTWRISAKLYSCHFAIHVWSDPHERSQRLIIDLVRREGIDGRAPDRPPLHFYSQLQAHCRHEDFLIRLAHCNHVTPLPFSITQVSFLSQLDISSSFPSGAPPTSGQSAMWPVDDLTWKKTTFR